jgi:hypothetical protein
MSEVKAGDRVRVVIEDYVAYAYEDGDIDIDTNESGSYRIGGPGVVSIEVIQPPFVLPTKRWAQVVDSYGYLWTLGADNPGVWYALTGYSLGSGGLIEREGLRVISEGLDDE